MPAARGATTVGEPSPQHPAQAPLEPGDRKEATTKAAARASRDRGPAAKGRRAPRSSPVGSWHRIPCGRPTERRLIPRESHRPGLDRRGVIGIHLLLAAAFASEKKDAAAIHFLSRVGVAATAGVPQRPADSTGGAAGWFTLGKKKPAGIFPAPLRSDLRSIRAWRRRLRAPRHSVGRSEQRHGPGPRSGAGREEAGMPSESARPRARLPMEGAVRRDGSPRPSPDEDHEQLLRPVGAEDEDPLDVAGAARAGDEGEHAR